MPHIYNGSSWSTLPLYVNSTTLSALTDANLGVLSNGHLLAYSGTKWVNTDALPDNTLFIKDDGDGTKKMQFQLSGLTTGSTVVLTVPNASTTIVGTDSTQTLTNKTFSDTLTTFQNTTTNIIKKI